MTGSSTTQADRANLPTRRRGMTSIVALVTLLVIGLICAGILKVALARRSVLGAEERRVQADALVDSGMERAMARLIANADFVGETWQISPEEMFGRGEAVVVIRVDRLADQPDRRKLVVQVEYPRRSPALVRRSRERVVFLPNSSKGPS